MGSGGQRGVAIAGGLHLRAGCMPNESTECQYVDPTARELNSSRVGVTFESA